MIKPVYADQIQPTTIVTTVSTSQVQQAIIAPTLSGNVYQDVHNAFVNAFGADAWPSADYVIQHESGYNLYATNPSSGACGLGQALPCAKMGCYLSDEQCQINWLIGYVKDRYQTPYAAYSHEIAYNWY